LVDWFGYLILQARCDNLKCTRAQLVEKFPEERLDEPFYDPKYGNYYRNLMVVIEHSYYHLGQIALLKKLIQ
jgi:hypothetical protein